MIGLALGRAEVDALDATDDGRGRAEEEVSAPVVLEAASGRRGVARLGRALAAEFVDSRREAGAELVVEEEEGARGVRPTADGLAATAVRAGVLAPEPEVEEVKRDKEGLGDGAGEAAADGLPDRGRLEVEAEGVAGGPAGRVGAVVADEDGRGLTRALRAVASA